LEICIDTFRYLDNFRQLGMKPKEEKQELDNVEREIRDYILQNQNKISLTENKVVAAMQDKEICSRMTCLKKIRGLKERGIIEDIKDRQNGFSCLVLKNKNEFKIISKQLTEIESVIKANAGPVHKLIEAGAANNISRLFTIAYNAEFLFPYLETVSTTLRLLLKGTDQMIQSKNDRQTLHTRIIDLMTELILQAYDLNNAKNLLLITRTKLSKARKDLEDPGTKNNLISFETVDRALKMLDNFELNVLPLIK
jgi:hypothetical protein